MKGILFDLDGTLLDSMGVWSNLAISFIEEKGLDYKGETADTQKGLSVEELPEFFKKTYNLQTSAQEIGDYIADTMAHHYRHSFEYKEGVVDLLEAFKAKGYKMCITTATLSYYCDLLDQRLDLRSYMDFIQSPDLVNTSKSDPAFFDIAIKNLGTDPAKTYVFDDALYAMENANSLGLYPVGVYDETSLGELDQIKEISHIYLETFKNLDMDLFL